MSLWKYYCLLRFSQTCELSSSKAAFTIAFFAAANHNYDHKQRTLKRRNTQNGSKSTNHQSQSMTFWTRISKVLFPKRSAKMIDCSENANTNWLLNFRIRVFLKSAENTKEMQVLYEPGFTSFPTLKLKNSRDGRGLISQSIWFLYLFISSTVTKVGRLFVNTQKISVSALIKLFSVNFRHLRYTLNVFLASDADDVAKSVTTDYKVSPLLTTYVLYYMYLCLCLDIIVNS